MKKLFWLIPLIILIMVISGLLIYRFYYGRHKVILKPNFVFATKRYYYRKGDRVKVYFNLIATDTDYTFFVDGNRINASYSDRLGYIIKFTMPDHDVIVTYESKNSMVYQPEFTVIASDKKISGYYQYYKLEDRVIYMDNEISDIQLVYSKISLKEYLSNTSLEAFLENLEYQSTVKDGGTTFYQDINGKFNVIVCNAINGNKNVYIVFNNEKFDINSCQL